MTFGNQIYILGESSLRRPETVQVVMSSLESKEAGLQNSAEQVALVGHTWQWFPELIGEQRMLF